jgi:DNA-binding transcriptional regulator LsrR (DeoR family)
MAPLDRPDLEIVSVMGGLTRGSDLNSFEITTRLADLTNAAHSYFTAPLYAGSREARDTIMQLDVFAEVLEKIRSADALAMAAGDISPRSLLMRDALPPDTTMADLRALGAVGDILGVVIDAAGRPMDHPVNERVIGVRLGDLARIPNVILAAGGPHKVPVLRAILGLGHIDTLVTDEATARAVLEAP